MTKRILFVTTSHDQMGTTEHKTGSWVEEVAAPYYTLKDAGVEVTIASIKGGEVPFDPNSLTLDALKPAPAQRFMKDKVAQEAIKNTPALDTLDPDNFDGVFIPGGHGVLWDLTEDKTLSALLTKYDHEHKLIAAVCHGPAGLAGATRQDGKPLVFGRKVTGFKNSEEVKVGLERVVPFALESKLSVLGGKFESGADFTPYAVQDGNLITGQNPMSSELVGEKILETLKG